MVSFWKSPAVVGTLSSLFFVILNVAMNIYMKWLFASEGGDFPLPWTMLAIQQLEAWLCLQPVICRKDPLGYGGWSFQRPEDRSDEVRPIESFHKPLEMVHLFQVLLVTLLFCLNVGLNSLSLVEISITLNQTVRAFLPVGVLLLSCIEQRAYPMHSYITAGILVSGIALTCYGNPDFQWHGFLLVFISTWVAAAGTSLNGFLLSKGPFSKGGPYGIARLMMIQSVPAFFIFGLIAWFSEREAVVDKLMDANGKWHWWERFLLVSVSSALALLSNLGRCFLVAATSALMETFAGNAKVAALCIIDHSLFGTAIYFHNYVGITLTFAGFSINLLLQYAVKDRKEDKSQSHADAAKTDIAMGGDDEEGEMPGHKSMVGAWMRPRLVSAADTGLLGEHFALEMGREHSRKRSPSDLSASTFTAEHRPRAMTWQQGVDPLLQPEHTAATWLSMNLEWGQIWEAPSLSWLNGDRSRVASASSLEEYSPLSSGSPAMRNNNGAPPASRSRFWSDQVHDRTPKSRRQDNANSPTFGDASGAALAPVQEEEDSAVELASRCRATSGGGGYATDSDEDGDPPADDWQKAFGGESPDEPSGNAREFEPGVGERPQGRQPVTGSKQNATRNGGGNDTDDDDDDEDEDEKVREHGETSPLVPSDAELLEVQRTLPPMDVGYL